MPAPGLQRGIRVPNPFGTLVAAVSVGICDGEPRLDLAYLEDRDAGVDANVVLLEPNRFVELQGTAEHGTFSRTSWRCCSVIAERGISRAVRGAAQGARLVRLLAATRSKGKQVEFRRLLEAAGHEVIFPDDAGIMLREELEDGLEVESTRSRGMPAGRRSTSRS